MLIDLSGSMADLIKHNGKDVSHAEMVQDVLNYFSNVLSKHDGNINLKIMTFSSKGYEGNRKSFEISASDLKNSLKTAELEQWIEKNIVAFYKAASFLRLEQTSGGTDYGEAFDQAVTWFNSLAAEGNFYENQTYFITDGEPQTDDGRDTNSLFRQLDQLSKVFAAGILNPKVTTLTKYDNTDANGAKVTAGQGEAQVLKKS